MKQSGYLSHLRKDKKLGSLLKAVPEVELLPQDNISLWLCYSIISQQLSMAAASTIKGRFNALYKGRPSMALITKTPISKLRSAGLSGSKSNYLKNVATFSLDQGLQPAIFKKMSDEEAIKYLTEIKGVGRWTAEMLLIFALARPDVFPAGDLGIQKAMMALYGIKSTKSLVKTMEKISEEWRPYRTYASLHLWKWKDGVKK